MNTIDHYNNELIFIHHYNDDFIYTKTTDTRTEAGLLYKNPRASELRGRNVYDLPAKATDKAIPEFEPICEYLQFDINTETWNIIKLDITLYFKSNGKLVENPKTADSSLYTDFPLPPEYNEGDEIVFDDDGEEPEWIILSLGLISLKKKKLELLENEYNNFQKIKIISNITIEYPIAGESYKKLKERVAQIKINFTGLIIVNDINNISYQSTLPSLLLEEILYLMNTPSENNYGYRDKKKNAILNCNSIKELDLIEINFEQPKEIDLDKLILELLNTPDDNLLYDNYTRRDIDEFKKFVEPLSKNNENKYIIFNENI